MYMFSVTTVLGQDSAGGWSWEVKSSLLAQRLRAHYNLADLRAQEGQGQTLNGPMKERSVTFPNYLFCTQPWTGSWSHLGLNLALSLGVY